eukprot:9211176-Pyramimonas_sp.AAC.1
MTGAPLFATPAVFCDGSGFQAPPLGKAPALEQGSRRGGQYTDDHVFERDRSSLAAQAHAQ